MQRITARGSGLELLVGIVALASGTWLTTAWGAPQLGRSAFENSTPTSNAPPALIGPRYDDDQALRQKAAAVASYTLTARLDPDTHLITGSGTIHWRNVSRKEVRELYLHLYLNAFKNDRTLFLRSPFVTARDGQGVSDFGHIDVKRLVAREFGSRDLWPDAERHSPEDPDDQTNIRVPLPEAIAPEGTLTLDVQFTAKLPSVVARTGHAGRFHLVAQWFPKIARLEPDGAFAHFAFHPQSEFYADFGDYDVTLDVPEGFVVGATGALVETSRAAGRVRLRHRAENVHDFAWTAWDAFREQSQQVDGVAVRVLFPPGHDENARRTLGVVQRALPLLSRQYGRYPYPTLTIVHPPAAGTNAGGMEYPTFITTGGPWYSPWTSVKNVELVTVHELAHQWFQGMVATDEHTFPFLDEGLAAYVEQSTMRTLYGNASLANVLGHPISEQAVRRSLAAASAHDDVIAKPAAQFSSWMSLGSVVYSRTATLLETLANVHGKEALERALGRYARYYRFDHPGPRNLVVALREVLGDEAAEQAAVGVFEGGFVDYSVEKPESVQVREARGVFDRASGRETVGVATPSSPPRYQSRVVVRRHGTLRFPVEVEFVLGDGRRRRQVWDGRSSWTAITIIDSAPVIAAVVDPDLRIVLDQDLTNNAASRGVAWAPRTLERSAYVAALLLGAMAP